MSVEYFPTEHKLATMLYVANLYTRGDESEMWPQGLRNTFIDGERPNTGPKSKKIVCTNDILNVNALFNNPIPNKCILQKPIFSDICNVHDANSPSLLDIVYSSTYGLYLKHTPTFETFLSLEIKIEINGHIEFIEFSTNPKRPEIGSIQIDNYIQDLPEDSLIPIKISGVNAYRGDSNSDFHTQIYYPFVECRLGTNLSWVDNTETPALGVIYLSENQSDWDPFYTGGGEGGGGGTPTDIYKTVYYITQHEGRYNIKARIGSNDGLYTVSSGGATANTGIMVNSGLYDENKWYVFLAEFSVGNERVLIYEKIKGPVDSENDLYLIN